jgi:hypothetical protein
MTSTNKPVQRVTERPYMVLFPNCRRKARQVVVRIDKGDILRFREKGRRQLYDLTIDQAFSIAVKATAGFHVCMVPGPSMRKGKKSHL